MSGHTPGPWHINSVGAAIVSGLDVTVRSEEGNLVALVGGWETTEGKATEMRLANGRLIAAAPEMLALLREVAIMADTHDGQRAEIEALLTRIDGKDGAG